MQSLLKRELQTTLLKEFGSSGRGCISGGQGYQTDEGVVYVKQNGKKGARLMFDGEFASLHAIRNTNTVNCPKPIKVLDDNSGGSMLVMEYVELKSLNKHSATLGTQLAQMHQHNIDLLNKANLNQSSVHKLPVETSFDTPGEQDDMMSSGVSQFGFHSPTCCGFIPQDNKWEENWETFYASKLDYQLNLIEEKYQDREAAELWSRLQLQLGDFFKGLQIKPSLVHGDLWSGNAAENDDGPLIFDAACFYGHHEYDFGIATMFGGFNSSFFNAYHEIFPKQPGFDKRIELYQLFHYLNHWTHFGGGYRGSSIGGMKSLLKK